MHAYYQQLTSSVDQISRKALVYCFMPASAKHGGSQISWHIYALNK